MFALGTGNRFQSWACVSIRQPGESTSAFKGLGKVREDVALPGQGWGRKQLSKSKLLEEDRWDSAGAEQSLALAPVEVLRLPWRF